MAFDVFISYAHHDNQAHEQWVHRFAEKLANDYRSRCGRTLNYFLDKDDLQVGNVLADRLQNALRASSLFIPILSPTYLASRWCRREFLHFLDQPEGVIAGESSRILPARLMPVDRFDPDADDRIETERIVGFINDMEILYADFHEGRLPMDQETRPFAEKIASLSEVVHELLKKRNPPPAPTPGGESLYFAYTSGATQSLRDGLFKEMEQQHKHKRIALRTLPHLPWEDIKDKPAAELERTIRAELSASVFSVHLFDDLEGPKAADSRAPVAHLQYQLALEKAKADPQFRLFYAYRITDDCSGAQEDMLNGIANDARQLANIIHLPDFERGAIKDFLLEHIQTRAAAPPPPEAVAGERPRRAFLVHDHRDKGDPIRNRIDDIIYNHNFDVYVPVFREDEPYVDPDASFRDFWMVCNKAVVLLRHATTAWCNAIKVELIKSATEKKGPYGMAVCVADPEVEKRIREVRSHEFEVINCALDDFEAKLTAFLLKIDRHA
jgi:hypothetical protein